MKSFKQHIDEQYMFRKRPDEIPPQVFGGKQPPPIDATLTSRPVVGGGPVVGPSLRGDTVPIPPSINPWQKQDDDPHCIPGVNCPPSIMKPHQPSGWVAPEPPIDDGDYGFDWRQGPDLSGIMGTEHEEHPPSGRWQTHSQGVAPRPPDPDEDPEEIIDWELDDPYSFRGITNDYGLLYKNQQNNIYDVE